MPLIDLARSLIDEPRWVETRFMLRFGEAYVSGLTADRRSFVAESERWPLVAVVGRPDACFIQDAALWSDDDTTMLCPEEHGDHVAAALRDWQRVGANVYSWPDTAPLPPAPPAPETRLISDAAIAELTHLPKTLHEELFVASEYSPVAAVFAGGIAVSFCYASSMTETLWDVSVDTLEESRGRGFATRAFQLIAHTLGQRGKRPVWGAADDNAASRRLANRLGFVESGRLALFTAPAR